MDTQTPNQVDEQLEFRSNGYIWTVRILQAIFAIVVLSNDASVASRWNGIGCTTPENISYIVTISAITFPLVIYIISTTGPFFSEFLWYNFWASVAFDTVFLILWIALASVHYTCTGLCNACPTDEVWAGTLFCYCYDGLYKREEPAINDSWNDTVKDALEAKYGLAVAELSLFIFTLCWTIYLHRKMEKKSKEEAAGPSGISGAEMGMAAESQVEASK